MTTLYVSDLDGTLLRSNETTSEYTNSIINGLADRGMIFSYATARSLITAKKVTNGIKAKIPLIVYNGAFIIDNVTDDILVANYFEYPGEKYKGKISKQEMKKMWKQKDFLENVLRERQWYEDTYHKIDSERYPALPPLPIVLKRSRSTIRVTIRWIGNNVRKLNRYIHSM